MKRPRHSATGAAELIRLRRETAALRARLRRLHAASPAHDGDTRFRQVIEASPVPLSVDDLRGKIEYVNRKFVETFGYSHREIPTSAQWFARAYPNPAYRRFVGVQWKASLRKGIASGREFDLPVVDVTCKDGTVRKVEFVGSMVGDRLFIAANDVTERERLERQILEISEQEQERIGQDIHDGLCQLLSGIKFKTTLLEQKLTARGLAQAQDAAALESLLNTAITQARNVARGLHPVDLEARGLMFALESLAASVSAVYGVACACRFGRPVLVHDHVVATHLYRIAQEAITNAIKHGRASAILVRLSRAGDGLTLEVQDNGVGFSARPKKRPGMGVPLMRYRARAIGAGLEIQTAQAGGATVTCRVRNLSLRPAATTPR